MEKDRKRKRRAFSAEYMTYVDPGISYYEERYRLRVIHNLE